MPCQNPWQRCQNRVGSCVTDSRFVSRPRRRDQRRTRRPVFRPTGARGGSVGYVRKRYKTSGGPCARLRPRTDPRSRMLIRLRSCLRERVSRRHSSAAQDPSGGGCLVTTPGHSGRAFSGCRRAMQEKLYTDRKVVSRRGWEVSAGRRAPTMRIKR